MTTTMKDTIRSLRKLKLGSPDEEPVIHLIGPWMTVTDLELMDVIHLPLCQIVSDLVTIREALSDVVDVMDDDQVQEAACRKIGKLNVYGDMIQDAGVAERAKITINWDGGRWLYITDPKLRMTESSVSYKTAKEAVFQMLKRT